MGLNAVCKEQGHKAGDLHYLPQIENSWLWSEKEKHLNVHITHRMTTGKQ